MTTPIAVCIPSIGRSGKMLDDLIAVVKAEIGVDVVEVWDNQEVLAPRTDVVIARAPGLTIYEEFNAFARMFNETHHLAILNDDIVLQSGAIRNLVGALGENYGLISGTDQPGGVGVRQTSGTRRRGGIRSEAFVVRQGAWPAEGIDERFQIWYGDDDLVWKIERAGWGIGVHEGVYVEHRHSTTISQMDWVPQAQAEDGRLWHKVLRRP